MEHPADTAGTTPGSAHSDHPAIERILHSKAFVAAQEHLARDHDRIIEENIALQQIAAPYLGEERKAGAFRSMLAAEGLDDVTIDEEGNVLGLRRGTAGGQQIVAFISHIDTVFPIETDLSVRWSGKLLFGPGMADDTRGLAAMLGMIRAINAAGIRHRRDILFVGSVGEEGLGDLRGVRYLFEQGTYRDRIAVALVHDGSEPARLTNAAVGSKRYKVVFAGPGGHSFGDFGLVNPLYAMARAAAALSEMEVPEHTTFNVGQVAGGTSVNAIPLEVHMLVDLRSTDPAMLVSLDERLRTIVDAAVDAENAARSTKRGAVAAKLQMIGQRPSGVTDPSQEIVRLAVASLAAQGWEARFSAASTDANIPISKGIPAVTIASGIGSNLHSLDEFIDTEPEQSVRQMSATLAALLALVEMEAT